MNYLYFLVKNKATLRIPLNYFSKSKFHLVILKIHHIVRLKYLSQKPSRSSEIAWSSNSLFIENKSMLAPVCWWKNYPSAPCVAMPTILSTMWPIIQWEFSRWIFEDENRKHANAIYSSYEEKKKQRWLHEGTYITSHTCFSCMGVVRIHGNHRSLSF